MKGSGSLRILSTKYHYLEMIFDEKLEGENAYNNGKNIIIRDMSDV